MSPSRASTISRAIRRSTPLLDQLARSHLDMEGELFIDLLIEWLHAIARIEVSVSSSALWSSSVLVPWSTFVFVVPVRSGFEVHGSRLAAPSSPDDPLLL